jgi:DHA1 family inner membrane transport protein
VKTTGGRNRDVTKVDPRRRRTGDGLAGNTLDRARGRMSTVSIRTNTTSPVLSLIALAVGTFAIGTTEFVIAGLLPEVATDLRVSIPMAGLLVSGYAGGVVVGAPLITTLVLRLPRRGVLLGLLALFVVGNVLCALAGDFAMMLAGRFVAALCHGSFIGIATLVATNLVAPEKKARAFAAMLSGLTVANVVGVPLGTGLGQALGWRSTFWAIAALGLLAVVAIIRWVPATGSSPTASVRSQLAGFRRGQVWLALAMTAAGFGAVYAPLTYVTPLMTSAGWARSDMTWLLALFGVGLVVGNLAGARAADRALLPTILVTLAALTMGLVGLGALATLRLPALSMFLVVGVLAFALVPGFTTRVITSASASADNVLASSAAVAAFNLGNATGAFLGGLAISAGLGYPATALVGAGMAFVALLIAGFSAAFGRRSS